MLKGNYTNNIDKASDSNIKRSFFWCIARFGNIFENHIPGYLLL